MPLLRRTVREILDVKPGADLATHEALLRLATPKQGHLRLVTTNFDALLSGLDIQAGAFSTMHRIFHPGGRLEQHCPFARRIGKP
jgi:hypothetical protein